MSAFNVAEVVRDLTTASEPFRDVGATPVAMAPVGYTLHSLEKYLPAPTRRRANVSLNDSKSLGAYATAHRTAGQEAFFDATDSCFWIVFDAAGWREDSCHFKMKKSVQWVAWTEHDGKRMSQEAFAEFIENHALDVRTPDGATLLEIATNLEAKKDVTFASAIRLADGSVEFTFMDDTKATGGKGKLAIPDTFMLALPVFEFGALVQVSARFRYRIHDGDLTLWYSLMQREDVEHTAVAGAVQEVETAIGMNVLLGKPSATPSNWMK